jgi:hypothetical protein
MNAAVFILSFLFGLSLNLTSPTLATVVDVEISDVPIEVPMDDLDPWYLPTQNVNTDD